MSQPSFQNREWNDLIFESRNKDYGAYVLRMEYEKNTARGLFLSFSLFGFIVIVGIALQFLKPVLPHNNFSDKITPVEPMDDFEIEQLKPPSSKLPETSPPPQKTNQEQFSNLKITNDPVSTTLPTQEKLTEVQAGSRTITDGSTTGENPVDTKPDFGSSSNTGGKEEIYLPGVVEKMPEFPGGDQGLMSYLTKNVKYNAEAKDAGIQGSIFISFVVNKEGKTEQVKILRGLCCGLNEVAMEVIKNMPAWSPGKMGEKNVKVPLSLKLSFQLK
jgi:protein TonB